MRYPSTYRGLKQDVGAVISEIFFPFLCFNEKVRRAKPGHPGERDDGPPARRGVGPLDWRRRARAGRRHDRPLARQRA